MATSTAQWQNIQQELLHMIAEEDATKEMLASTGELYKVIYHPAMEKVHLKHAKRLKEIVDANGFPTLDNVSEEACIAALKIILHVISDPEFMRQQEALVSDLARENKVPKMYAAFITDRIRFYEGRKQIYGTYTDWDENGIRRISDVEDEENLNQRRATMGLEPLESMVITPLTGEYHPPQPKKRYDEFLEWTRKVGWRTISS